MLGPPLPWVVSLINIVLNIVLSDNDNFNERETVRKYQSSEGRITHFKSSAGCNENRNKTKQNFKKKKRTRKKKKKKKKNEKEEKKKKEKKKKEKKKKEKEKSLRVDGQTNQR